MSANPIIGFAGMTHLGVNSIVAAAQKGFHAVGFDTDRARISTLQSGKTDISEPELSDMLHANTARLQFISSPEGLRHCDIIYISMDVPTDDDAKSDLTPVHAMIERVSAAMREDALLIVLCQVPPGFTRAVPRDPAKLYYQVETLIFGRAVERALFPERTIIGCADPSAPLDPRYRQFLEAYACPLLPMRFESAELAKTAINLFLAASVSTANTLAEVCEKIGADWQEIIPSLRLDKRIGPHAYIEPGLGLSGGNIERDLRTVSQLGEAHGAKVNVPMAYIEHSVYRKKWPIRAFFEHYNRRPDFTLCVLGLAYKINTHSIKNSPAVDLIEAMPDIRIQAYDPVVKTITSQKDVRCCGSVVEAAKDADMLCVMTPWDDFKTLDWNAVKTAMRGKILIDPYRLMSPEQAAGCVHLVLGKA